AGEQGRGLATVGDEVKLLSDEIKDLVATVESRIGDVEQGTAQLSASIQTSHQALGESISKVDETYEMFDHITKAAEETESVQSEISLVIDDSKSKLHTLDDFFDRIKKQYGKVMQHINRVNIMGTTKSAMYEDIDNMIAQIPPIINDYTGQ
ncbi:MAG: chemotaxis protein, partial [Lachnospiraceae bacterium]|nr:chemotaxis protein [Lachnospiraceae bacterium]